MKLILAVLALLIATPARAEWVDGNKLHDWCSSSGTELACTTYVLGVLDGSYLKTPERATAGQVKDVIKKYLRDHPENRDFPASLLVSLAVVDAWPTLNTPKK